jgi:septum formation protein
MTTLDLAVAPVVDKATRRAVVLASSSAARAALLRAVGVPVIIEAPAIDEDAVKASLRASRATAAAMAELLAELKARRVAERHEGALVIGADQVLDCDGVAFDKPADTAAARRQLLVLRGRRHELVSAVVLVRDGQRLWHHVDRARLTMRAFSEDFVDFYLQSAGAAVLGCVGAYQLEGIGAQLFSQIEGDYFTILGLPLLPLLEMLRTHGVLSV